MQRERRANKSLKRRKERLGCVDTEGVKIEDVELYPSGAGRAERLARSWRHNLPGAVWLQKTLVPTRSRETREKAKGVGWSCSGRA